LDLDDFKRIADHALRDIESILKDWYPNGVIQGREFCIGNASGAAGQSLRIRLRGDDGKVGWWSDFAAGEAGRDLISLYALKEGISQGRACAALAKDFGIELAPSDRAHAQRGGVAPAPKTPQELAPAQARQGVEEKKPRTEWEPVLPVPERAGPYPVAHLTRGRPEAQWKYV
jgi:putative DNA primase/helicase